MLDIIGILGIISGVILLIIGIKKPNLKPLKIFGILIIIIMSLVIVAPDFIKGFKEGWNAASKY
jgi:hypothetical protein